MSARPWLVLGALAASAIAHEALVRALDRAGLVEQLLSPSASSAIGALLASVALLALRLTLVGLGPPIAAAALIMALWPTAPRRWNVSARGRRASGPRP